MKAIKIATGRCAGARRTEGKGDRIKSRTKLWSRGFSRSRIIRVSFPMLAESERYRTFWKFAKTKRAYVIRQVFGKKIRISGIGIESNAAQSRARIKHQNRAFTELVTRAKDRADWISAITINLTYRSITRFSSIHKDVYLHAGICYSWSCITRIPEQRGSEGA